MHPLQSPSWSTAARMNVSNISPSGSSESFEPYYQFPASAGNAIGAKGTDPKLFGEPPQVQALDFSQLAPFETVTDQFIALGLQVEGAIALQPSNPIFWTRQQAIVLMPTADRKSIDLIFVRAVRYLAVSVMGVREVRMTATTGDRRQVIHRSENPNRPLQHPEDLMEPLKPSLLEIDGEALVRVRLESSHPFVLVNVMYAPA